MEFIDQVAENDKLPSTHSILGYAVGHGHSHSRVFQAVALGSHTT